MTAKTIAKSAEGKYLENDAYGITTEITCTNIPNIPKDDISSCKIEFNDEGVAIVTIEGKGKYRDLRVCEGTKSSSIVIKGHCPIPVITYIDKLLENESTLNNGLVETKVEHEGTIYNTGIRYIGDIKEVNNKIYFNCDDKDENNEVYGSENYDYASSREVWRIIGLFDVRQSKDVKLEKRLKIINAESTFAATWDSSSAEGENAANKGYGINQWGESGNYEGSDLMRLLNDYYIGKENATCTYCTSYNQETCCEICTAESLKNFKMKVLTSTAKKMIDVAVWDTYAVHKNLDTLTSSNAGIAYLQEKGISTQYTGKSLCETHGANYCKDNVVRTTSRTGLVGLMSASDIGYANGWLYYRNNSTFFSWSISPRASTGNSNEAWNAGGTNSYGYNVNVKRGVWPTVYLKSNIRIKSGNGNETPYIIIF